MKAFLVLHRGALGDFVLTWPTLAALRAKYSGHHFLALGRPDYLELAKAVGLIDGGIDCEAAALTPFLAGEALPDFIGNADAALLWTRYDPKISGLLERSCSGPVVFHPPFPEDKIHVLEHHLRSLSRFGLSPVLQREPNFSLGLCSDPKEKGCALIHPGSGSPAKNYSPEFYAGLRKALQEEGYSDTRIVLGPAEKELRRHYEGHFVVEEPASVLQLAELMIASALFVGNDSGASHLAASMGVPTLALYKSTDPARWGVRGPASHALTAKDEAEARSRIREILRSRSFTSSSIRSELISQALL